MMKEKCTISVQYKKCTISVQYKKCTKSEEMLCSVQREDTHQI